MNPLATALDGARLARRVNAQFPGGAFLIENFLAGGPPASSERTAGIVITALLTSTKPNKLFLVCKSAWRDRPLEFVANVSSPRGTSLRYVSG
jgi:hypothetical protein